MKTDSKECFNRKNVEDDTTILEDMYGVIDGVPINLENWYCDGIYGTSYILPANEVVCALSDEELIGWLEKHAPIVRPFTIVRNLDFVFVNHNFDY